MSERRERVISEIKEVAERIEVTLSEYRTRYYKEIPAATKKKIYSSLEKAFFETDKLCFVHEMEQYDYFNKIAKSKCKYTTETVYIHLENIVNETLKYFNDEFANNIYKFINTLQKELKCNGYCVDVAFNCLKEDLIADNAFESICEKYPNLIELKDCILTITKIEFLSRTILRPEVHELYGLKLLLSELEEKISRLGTNSFNNTDYYNIILEYIDCRINMDWFKNIT